MREGVVHEVDARLVGVVPPRRFLAHHHGHGVVGDGRAAIDLLVGFHHAAVGQLRTGHVRRDDFHHGSFGLGRFLEIGDYLRVGALGDVDAQLAALEAAGAVLDDR